MHLLDEFPDILLRNESLAPYTWLKVGGPAQFFLTPRSVDELAKILRTCSEQGIAVHLLGGGSNLLVRDEGVSGAVVRLSDSAFSAVTIEGTTVRTGAGALLSHIIAETVRAGLAGFETLSGIPGTIGGAIHGNAGGRHGEIGPLVKEVLLMDAQGQTLTRSRDELNFSYRQSGVDDLLVLEVTFELHRDDPDQIADRLRKLWITKKASQPLSSQSAGCIFRNPRGLSAGELIEQAGLKGTRIGGAEVSDRHANFIVTHQGCTSADVFRLIDLIRSKVSAQFGVPLETEVQIW